MITLLAVQSADGFIASIDGNGSLRSRRDRAELHNFLRSPAIDGFIVGRRTFEEFGKFFNYKPCYLFTREYTHDWDKLAREKNLALLGGAETYRYFLMHDLVDEARITTNRRFNFGRGLPLGFEEFTPRFAKISTVPLLPTVETTIYKKSDNRERA